MKESGREREVGVRGGESGREWREVERKGSVEGGGSKIEDRKLQYNTVQYSTGAKRLLQTTPLSSGESPASNW